MKLNIVSIDCVCGAMLYLPEVSDVGEEYYVEELVNPDDATVQNIVSELSAKAADKLIKELKEDYVISGVRCSISTYEEKKVGVLICGKNGAKKSLAKHWEGAFFPVQFFNL
jgi:hypothetical protein